MTGVALRQLESKAFTKRSSLGVDEQRVRVVIGLTTLRARGAPRGDGYRVDAAIDRGASAPTAIVVPAGALVWHADIWAVYRYHDWRVALGPVRVGLRNDLQAEIPGGLEFRDRVILFPSDAVTDGSRVVPRAR